MPPQKQVAQRPPPKRIEPSSAPMLVGIVEHVTSLAECGEVVRGIVSRIVVEMGARK
jgi:hypothetical protein